MVRDEYEDGIWVQDIEALNLALSALRPVSREQVERMRGEWIVKHDKYKVVQSLQGYAYARKIPRCIGAYARCAGMR